MGEKFNKSASETAKAECKCAKCLCADCEFKSNYKDLNSCPICLNSHHCKSAQILDCTCRDCVCKPCDYMVGDQIQPSVDKKLSDVCICATCYCKPCKRKSNSRPALHLPDCSCERCLCPGTLDAKKEVAIRSAAAIPASHPENCSCSTCTCNPCNPSSIPVSYPESNSVHVSHPENCNCSTCTCNPCKPKRIPLPPLVNANSKECSCTTCTCKPCPRKPGEQSGKSDKLDVKSCGCFGCECCDRCKPFTESRTAVGGPDCRCTKCTCQPCYAQLLNNKRSISKPPSEGRVSEQKTSTQRVSEQRASAQRVAEPSVGEPRASAKIVSEQRVSAQRVTDSRVSAHKVEAKVSSQKRPTSAGSDINCKCKVCKCNDRDKSMDKLATKVPSLPTIVGDGCGVSKCTCPPPCDCKNSRTPSIKKESSKTSTGIKVTQALPKACTCKPQCDCVYCPALEAENPTKPSCTCRGCCDCVYCPGFDEDPNQATEAAKHTRFPFEDIRPCSCPKPCGCENCPGLAQINPAEERRAAAGAEVTVQKPTYKPKGKCSCENKGCCKENCSGKVFPTEDLVSGNVKESAKNSVREDIFTEIGAQPNTSPPGVASFQICDVRKLTEDSLLVKWSPANIACLCGYEVSFTII